MQKTDHHPVEDDHDATLLEDLSFFGGVLLVLVALAVALYYVPAEILAGVAVLCLLPVLLYAIWHD